MGVLYNTEVCRGAEPSNVYLISVPGVGCVSIIDCVEAYRPDLTDAIGGANTTSPFGDSFLEPGLGWLR